MMQINEFVKPEQITEICKKHILDPNDKRKWLAVWDFGRKGKKPSGYNRDCYPDEIIRYIKSERANGMMVAGPFNTGEEAIQFALARLREWAALVRMQNQNVK